MRTKIGAFTNWYQYEEARPPKKKASKRRYLRTSSVLKASLGEPSGNGMAACCYR
jgi:hypothetical protein